MTEFASAPLARPWSFSLRLEDVPEAGRHFELNADESTRAALATFAHVREVRSAGASFDVVRHGRDGLRVTGEVRGMVGQTCVVTLEPIDSEIIETVDVVFKTAVGAEGAEKEKEHASEPPEPLIDGAVDLGVLASEFLVLGIDPYPRKPDAVFSPPEPASPADGPFAALAKLKDGGATKK